MEANLADLFEAVADVAADRECLVWRERRLSYAAVRDRMRRLANHFRTHGLGLHRERAGLPAWESGQDHAALLLYNGPEYLESMLGAFAARLAPVNVNYRYTGAELTSLLLDCRARALIYHGSFAPVVAEIRRHLPHLELLLLVDDATGTPLLDGALDYEETLCRSSDDPPAVQRSPDDLYILYTGGTTGKPKGVLWRQADIYVAAMGGRLRDGQEPASVEAVVERARKGGLRYLPTAPFMHAAHWTAFDALLAGHTVVIQDETRRLDAESILRTVERERINLLLIIGDAFARPLIEAMGRRSWDLSSMKVLGNGGAVLGAHSKEELLRLLPPGARISDTVGSSETGRQAQHESRAGTAATTGTFRPGPGACVLSEDLTRQLDAAHDELGWFAQSGRVPLGYLGDRDKTARTFPVVGGTRYSIPGDRARVRADGSIEVLGRDSTTINTGGEKVFAEEVEQALKRHPAVADAIVCGRPHPRFGQEVAALVQLRPGAVATLEELAASCRNELAGYKAPRTVVFVTEVQRSPNGKADYAWAKARLAESGSAT